MSTKIRMIKNVMLTAIELMSVAGCGYNSARNSTGSQEVGIHSIDIQAMKDAAMSNSEMVRAMSYVHNNVPTKK